MRTILLFLFLSLAVKAEDWTTLDGKTYKGVTVLKVEPDAVTILDGDGGALVSLASLPTDLQKRFNYDPAKAKVAADSRAKADAANAQALQEEKSQAVDLRNRELLREAEEQAPPVARIYVKGIVFEKTQDGLLVDCISILYPAASGTPQHPNPPGHPIQGTCLLKDYPHADEVVDGDVVQTEVKREGPYSYPAVDGSQATVASYSSIDPNKSLSSR